MTKKKLSECLRREVEAWASKPFQLLSDELKQTACYVSECDDEKIHTYVYLLEANDEYLNVSVHVSNSGLFRYFFPLSHNFLVFKNGRVEK